MSEQPQATATTQPEAADDESEAAQPSAGIAPPLTIEYRRPWLYRKQLEAVFGPERMGLIEASTKAGKTVSCIAWLVEQAMLGGGNGKNYWWVAPVGAQADIAFTRLLRFLPQGTFSASRAANRKTVVLLNGAVIWFKGGDRPDSLYGDDVYAAVIDEASRLKENAWHAVRSTLTFTRGPIRIIGNVKGRRNWFYQLARQAEQQGASADMDYHRLIAHDAVEAGVLSAVEVASAKRDLPERVFKELYLAQPSDDGGNPFGYDKIHACASLTSGLSTKEPVAWGWDLAKSQDWTVGIGLDEDWAVCRFHRFQRSWGDTRKIILHETAGEPALVDSTGVGDPVVEELQREGGSNFMGYHFTGPSKQKLMEGLMMAVHKVEVHYPPKVDAPDPSDPAHIVLEMENFEYTYTATGVRYSAPAGFHDDTVCSLGLAVACKTENRGLDVWEKLAG